MLTMQNSIKLAKEATPQQAFVFIKPHACTEKVIELVKAKFSEVGVSIISEGRSTARPSTRRSSLISTVSARGSYRIQRSCGRSGRHPNTTTTTT